VIEFHRLALEELRQAQAWYREKSLQAAERFFQQTSRTIERLLTDPSSYAKIGRGCHYVRISRFPFVLIYRIRSQNEVFVVAVAHTARRRYWRNRR
jgi:plasmid stabilization system protein ParE